MRQLAVVVLVFGLVSAACAEGEPMASDGVETTTTTTTDESASTTAPDTTSTTSTTSTTPAAGGGVTDPLFSELVERVLNAPELTSGRMEVTVAVSGLENAGPGPTDASFGFSTAFDTEANVSSFVMDLSSLADAMPADEEGAEFLAAFAGTMEMRQIGDTAYVKMPFFSELLGVETPWLSMPADQGDDFTSGIGTVPADPADVLTAYEGAAASVEDLGVDTVGGVEATHYRISFDTTTWVDDLSADERAELEASGLFAAGVLPMEIWLTAEGHLVRLLFELDGSTIESPPGEGFSSMEMRYEMTDIGRPVTVVAPASSEVTSVDDLGFGAFDFGFDA